jgi:hypothetical protein
LQRRIYRGSGPATARNGLFPTAACRREVRPFGRFPADRSGSAVTSAAPADPVIAAELVFCVQTKVGVFKSFLKSFLRFGQLIQRQQAVLDRALKRAERGDLDYSAPSLLG